MSFHEVRLPEDLSPGVQWGAAWSTVVIVTGAGYEQRLQQWSTPRRTGRIELNLRTSDQAEALVAFFLARAGRAYGFRYKDWSDYQATDEPLDHDEATTVQLTKTYTSGGVSRVRNIYKPVAGTVTLEVNGSPYTAFLLDENSGTVYLSGALDPGDVLTWSGEYDVPVRFDTDVQELVQQAPDWRDWGNIPIVEVREAPVAVAPTLDPLDASVAGALELYLRSDQVTGANGAAVASWPDLGPNNWDVVQATGTQQPAVLDPGSANGTRLVRFAGGNAPNGDTMGLGGLTLPGNTAGYTFYIYGDLKTRFDINTGNYVFSTNGGGAPMLIHASDDEGLALPEDAIGFRDGGGFDVGGTSIFGFQTMSWVFELPNDGSGVATVYQNGEAGHTTTWDFAMSVDSGINVAGNQSQQMCAKMDLGALIIFSAAHAPETRLGIELFLREFFES